jgi:hypothetical protein
MPNMAKDDAKIKEKIDQERQLTIMMLVYISIICLNWLYLREIIFLSFSWIRGCLDTLLYYIIYDSCIW